DILIYSTSIEAHLKHLEEVLQRLRAAGLMLKPSKCTMVQNEVVYLGHLLSHNSVRPDPHNTAKVRDFPVPHDTTTLRSFMGLCSYYRKFVQNFAQLVAPLQRQLCNGAKFDWSVECQIAYDKLKQLLCSAPILRLPDTTRPFVLQTDASGEALGAVLSQ